MLIFRGTNKLTVSRLHSSATYLAIPAHISFQYLNMYWTHFSSKGTSQKSTQFFGASCCHLSTSPALTGASLASCLFCQQRLIASCCHGGATRWRLGWRVKTHVGWLFLFQLLLAFPCFFSMDWGITWKKNWSFQRWNQHLVMEDHEKTVSSSVICEVSGPLRTRCLEPPFKLGWLVVTLMITR